MRIRTCPDGRTLTEPRTNGEYYDDLLLSASGSDLLLCIEEKFFLSFRIILLSVISLGEVSCAVDATFS